MKHSIIIIALLLAHCGFGQVDDRTETNCESETRSVYSVGDAGRPLLVASKAFDCSICMSHADNFADLANQYSGEIEVWAAMTRVYSSETPTCEDLASWEDDYGWGEAIFSFIDEEQYWLDSGTPRYIVIHPETHAIAYAGSSYGNAFNVANDLVSMGIDDNLSNEKRFELSPFPGFLRITWNGKQPMHGEVLIFNIVGQRIQDKTFRFEPGSPVNFAFSGNPGIYIATLKTEKGTESHRFVIPNR